MVLVSAQTYKACPDKIGAFELQNLTVDGGGVAFDLVNSTAEDFNELTMVPSGTFEAGFRRTDDGQLVEEPPRPHFNAGTSQPWHFFAKGQGPFEGPYDLQLTAIVNSTATGRKEYSIACSGEFFDVARSQGMWWARVWFDWLPEVFKVLGAVYVLGLLWLLAQGLFLEKTPLRRKRALILFGVFLVLPLVLAIIWGIIFSSMIVY